MKTKILSLTLFLALGATAACLAVSTERHAAVAALALYWPLDETGWVTGDRESSPNYCSGIETNTDSSSDYYNGYRIKFPTTTTPGTFVHMHRPASIAARTKWRRYS